MRVAILGSTGSIGVNTLDVMARHPGRFQAFALAANTQVDTMMAQCATHRPSFAFMANEQASRDLEERLAANGLPTRVLRGDGALESLAGHPEVDAVMAAIVGAAGLPSSLAAARSGKRLLLANKEALVVGGQLFLDAVKQGGAKLLPIDSEHSAVFQSLPADASTWGPQVEKIILTGSGGPFRTRDPATMHAVTPAEAIAHPNWVMGKKISVDSATMMNKALEVIEAKYLFGVDAEQIEVVIHPQSVIHSMVQFKDSSVVAQLGTPDMRGPIAYGLSWPDRIDNGAQPLDFTRMGALTFEPPDPVRFPGLQLAWDALRAPSGATAVLNAANEVAVDAFLRGLIRFDHVYRVNTETYTQVVPSDVGSLAALLALDAEARAFASRVVRGLAR